MKSSTWTKAKTRDYRKRDGLKKLKLGLLKLVSGLTAWKTLQLLRRKRENGKRKKGKLKEKANLFSMDSSFHSKTECMGLTLRL